MTAELLHGVLVTFRRPEQLELTLKRLDVQTRRLDTLVVIDNDPDETARSVVARFASGAEYPVHYLATGQNRGPAGGIARGMRHVLERASDHDWMVLLDDDDPPRTTDMFGVLAEFATSLRAVDPDVAAVGKSGTRFDLRRARTLRVPDESLTGAVRSDCVGGNQLPFCSVRAIRAVGVFDERLFFGFDDLEFGLRLWSAGFRVFVHGGLWYEDRAYHGRLQMRTPPDRRLVEPSWRRYYSIRNLIYILRKMGHRKSALWLASRSIAKPLYNVPRDPALAVRHLRLATRAVVDAYSGRMGRTVEPAPK